MSESQPKNPLHGVTLEMMLNHLVALTAGRKWAGTVRRVRTPCDSPTLIQERIAGGAIVESPCDLSNRRANRRTAGRQQIDRVPAGASGGLAPHQVDYLLRFRRTGH